ncbi:PLC-like phosphodiesterase [Lasiosphaeris hirsuta]|uniref:PLC-like phosphodiesterase n=1 Tax=Lasiosphaeris hirsuta TaxID=260670 RepID=A0AA40B0F4_9PEZI|nr:PLC-like phosphodiesterase [Lasiosphaeris hirsuta]
MDFSGRGSYLLVGGTSRYSWQYVCAVKELERRGARSAHFLLVNATPWTFREAGQHTYQMESWEFPPTIAPGTSARIYMKGESGQDDGGEFSYAIDGLSTGSEPSVFEVQYRGVGLFSDPVVQVKFSSLETLHNFAGSTLQLEWREDNNIPFIVASSEENPASPSIQPMIVSSNPPEDWMHATYERIACLSLRELTMPGTHDTGMSVVSSGGSGAAFLNEDVVITQKLGIREQLQFGARWFDIRPVISGGDWTTGHYSFGAGQWQGANGEYLLPMIDRINEFTAANKELVILNLSHGLNTDLFAGDKGNRLTQAEWEELMTMLLGLQNRVTGRGGEADISQLKVSDLISDRAAVLIVVDDLIDGRDNERVNIGDFADKGFFRRDQMPLFDRFADEDDQDKMIADQLAKLKTQRQANDSEMFLLSWTLTQSDILDLATQSNIKNGQAANRALIEKLWPEMSSSSYPNIINVDAYPRNGEIAALAMAINYQFAKNC